jgi:hypothetical protein
MNQISGNGPLVGDLTNCLEKGKIAALHAEEISMYLCLYRKMRRMN